MGKPSKESSSSRRKKWLRRIAIACGLLLLLLACIAETAVLIASAGRIADDLSDLPHCNAAVVPGCSKSLRGGGANQYFRARIAAAAELYHARKVGIVIVSGDNRHRGYDEPTDMKEALVRLGVPEERIVCDYAGLRTLDTVVRAHDVFQQSDFILVSQRFQLRRALFLARCHGIRARGFAAEEVRAGCKPLLRQIARERLARIAALLDVAFRRKPRFLGPLENPPMRYVPSPNHSERTRPVSIIVLHYTATSTLESAVRILTTPNTPKPVSSHYVVGVDGEVVQLVPEDRRAQHAGISYWRGETDLNSASIGIEIVNMGPDANGNHPPFPDAQIEAVCRLCHDIQEHYPITDVVGHSDVAPKRKQDPGAAFPWRRLAAEGIGLWTDEFVASDTPNAKLLASIGYDVSDPAAALLAFQRHYYPEAILSGGKRTHERLAAVERLFQKRK